MKINKTMTILSLACTAFLLTACGHKDSTKENASSSSVKVEKTTKTSKSSSMTKSSSKEKMTTDKSSTETKASTSDKSDNTQTQGSSSVQTPASSQVTTQTSGGSQTGQASQNAQTTSELGKGDAIVDTPKGGYGVTNPTSGTLDLEQAVPAYTGTNKDLGAVYTIPAGSIFWDQYLLGDDGNYWFSYMGYDGNRYYIAYEDVRH